MNNGDLLRNMTNEQLAVALYSVIMSTTERTVSKINKKICEVANVNGALSFTSIPLLEYTAILNWLNKEADE